MIDLLVKGLAAWRLSYLLINERGPLDIITKFRTAVGIEHDGAGQPVSWPDNHVLGCMWCTTVWASIGLGLLPRQASIVEKVLAVAAIAILVEERPKTPLFPSFPPIPAFEGLPREVAHGPSNDSNSIDPGSLFRANRAASSAREPGDGS